MEFIIAALVLGLAGSLHCIGMCGPLMLALPTNAHWTSTRLLNQLGRILTYALLGAIVGAMGQTLKALGFQQILAVASGILMLLFIAWPAGMKKTFLNMKWTQKIKKPFAHLIEKRSHLSFFLLGVLNGLLPCGLVYVALSASLPLGSIAKSALFMGLFGLGTSPALLAIGSIASWIKTKLRWQSYRVIQISLAMLALLFILRGANLGIPYVSPQLKAETHEMDCCKHRH
ncbi:MAG: sulfite exporter TauE/SafE family protein [Flavobacteriales bacterium]